MDGAWDGPVYARLLQSRHIQPGHVSPFVVDDSSRRPGWVCQLIYCRTESEDANAIAEDPTLQNVVIPFSRLTRPSNDLSRELRDRPLLLLFRFVRFKSCYMASSGPTPRRFVEVPLAVFLVGQVVAYLPSDGATFSAPSGATLQPTARYLCVVAVRQPADGQAVHVVIPCNSAWDSIISRDEFVVGWCHGVPATSQPARRMARFRSRWSEFVITPSQDAVLQRLLHDTFVPSGSDNQVDFGTQRLRLITEFGRVITVSPLSYAKTYIGPARPSTRMDIDEDSDSESPAEILAVGFSRGLPLPRGTPDIVRQDALPFLSPPVPHTWYSASPSGASNSELNAESCSTPLLGALPEQARLDQPRASSDEGPQDQKAALSASRPSTLSQDAMMATLVALTQSTQQIAAATQQILQQQMQDRRPRLHEQLPPPSEGPPHATSGADDPRWPGHRQTLPVERSAHLRDHRIGPSGGSPRHERPHTSRRSRSPGPRFHPYHSRDPSRSRSPRTRRPRERSCSRDRGRSRSRSRSPVFRSPRPENRSDPRASVSAGYDDRWSDSPRRLGPGHRTYYDSPHGRRAEPSGVIDRSPPRVPLQHRHRSPSPERARASSRHIRDAVDTDQRRPQGPARDQRLQFRDGDEQTLDGLLSGVTSFRPPAAEVQVHQVAHVGPRPNGTYSERDFLSFWRLSLLDRVSAIQHHESLRNRYCVTKVTAKMLFSVNFGTRQLDHFLPIARSGNERSVTHDPATWSSADTSPVALIHSIEDLRSTLYSIQEAATEWYPRPVAEVFRSVHADSIDRLLDHAPRGLVCATINLYTHVFTTLFHAIREEQPAAGLVPQARGILSRESEDYRRLVRSVIDQALISTWARQSSSTGQSRNQRTEHRSRSSQSSHNQRQQNSTSGALPSTIRAQVPLHEGKVTCLRFQTVNRCDFNGCSKAHALVSLPTAVVTFLTGKHGGLKPGHPNLSA